MLLCTWARSTLSLSHNSAHDIDTRARGPGGGYTTSLQPGVSSLQSGVLSSARRPLLSPASSLQPGVLSSVRRPLFSPASSLLTSSARRVLIFSPACPLFSPARPLFSPALSLQPASSLQPGVLSSARRPLFSPEMPKCEWSRVECHAHEGEVPKIVLAAFFGKGYYGPFFGVQYCNGNIRKACQK